jgi:hypothetical protein
MAKSRRGSSREDLLNPYAAIDSTVPRIARSRERRHHGQTEDRWCGRRTPRQNSVHIQI